MTPLKLRNQAFVNILVSTDRNMMLFIILKTSKLTLDQRGEGVLLMPSRQWTADASSTLNSFAAYRVIDSSLSTFFHSAHSSSPYEWLQVNFAKEIKVREPPQLVIEISRPLNVFYFIFSMLNLNKKN